MHPERRIECGLISREDNMKYRIKIITYKTGRIEYYAQAKEWFYWTGLSSDGETGYSGWSESRVDALDKIDKHYNGNTKRQSIVFEYITKS